MAAIAIAPPGTDFGPCLDACSHSDCAQTRQDADMPCGVCGDPIGYGRPHYRGTVVGWAHQVCYMQKIEDERKDT